MKVQCIRCGKPIYVFPSYRARRPANTGACRQCSYILRRQNPDVVIKEERPRFHVFLNPVLHRMMIRILPGWQAKGRIKDKAVTMYLARFLMECKLGRPLTDQKMVLHKNGDKMDERIENLYLCDRAEVTRLTAERTLAEGRPWGVRPGSSRKPKASKFTSDGDFHGGFHRNR